MRLKSVISLVGATILVFAPSAFAGLTFVLTPGTQLGARSNAVVFTGTLANTSATDNLYLNDIQFSFTGVATNYFSGSGSTFFANVPGILLPGESYSDVVFVVAIDPTTPLGDYPGSATIIGGSNIFDVSILATQVFQVSVFDTLFDVWRFDHFGANTNNPAISGPLADPDGDGIVNLLEYAFNLDPNVGDVAGLPAPQIDPDCVCLTLIYRKVLGATDLLYTPEAAGEATGPWVTNSIAQTIIDADLVSQIIKVRDIGNPIATATSRFMHIGITSSP